MTSRLQGSIRRRNNYTTSITKLNGTGTDLSLTVTNASAVARIKWGWRL
jgi:hypothetical protein